MRGNHVLQHPVAPAMVVTGEWSPDLQRRFGELKCSELELNYAKGWRGYNLDFLRGSIADSVTGLVLIDWNIEDIEPVMHLSNLRSLQLSTYSKTKIDFSSFPNLEDLALEWNVTHQSLFGHPRLISIFLNRYSGKDLSKFSTLPQIRSLALAGPKIESLGGAELRSLLTLGVYAAKKLRGLEGLENFSSLQRLELDDSRGVSDLSLVGQLKKLRFLSVCNGGPISTLKPIENLPELRELYFHGTTNVLDGNLEGIAKLSLERVAFQDRDHYSRRLQSFTV